MVFEWLKSLIGSGENQDGQSHDEPEANALDQDVAQARETANRLRKLRSLENMGYFKAKKDAVIYAGMSAFLALSSAGTYLTRQPSSRMPYALLGLISMASAYMALKRYGDARKIMKMVGKIRRMAQG